MPAPEAPEDLQDQSPTPDYDKEPVPRIGRGRRRRKITYFPPGEVISIFALIIGLFAVVSMKDSCARGAEGLFKAFEVPADAGAHAPSTGSPVPRP